MWTFLLAVALTIAICGLVPFLACRVAFRLHPHMSATKLLCFSTLAVPVISILLAGSAIYVTYRDGISFPEDDYRLAIFVWVMLGSYFVVLGLPIGFVAGKLARRRP